MRVTVSWWYTNRMIYMILYQGTSRGWNQRGEESSGEEQGTESTRWRGREWDKTAISPWAVRRGAEG